MFKLLAALLRSRKGSDVSQRSAQVVELPLVVGHRIYYYDKEMEDYAVYDYESAVIETGVMPPETAERHE